MLGRLIVNDVKRNLLSKSAIIAWLALVVLQWYPVYLEMRLTPNIVNDPLYYLVMFAGKNSALFYTIVAIPCAMSWPDDHNYGMSTYISTRASAKLYAFAKTLSAWLSYFLFCGTAVFFFVISVILWTHFTGEPVDRFFIHSGIDLHLTYYYIASKGVLLYAIARTIVLALLASMWSMLSFLVSVYYSNVFLTIAMPPIIVYFVINLMGKLSVPGYLSPIVVGQDFFHLGSIASTLLYTLAYCLIISGILAWFSYRKMVKEVTHA
ncbi:MAG: hypothetical protein ACOYEL_06860 [Saccharofermentanales bacterium]|jgi:hypothetical protein